MNDESVLQALTCRMEDALYNHAVLTRPETFIALATSQGAQLFKTTDMPTKSEGGGKWKTAHKNTLPRPVVIYVRAEPFIITKPPTPIMVEDSILMVSIGGGSEDSMVGASIVKSSKGDSLAVLLLPNQSARVCVMASGDINVTWRVLPLRGRDNVFPG